MKFADVLALRPTGTDAGSLSVAISNAEVARAQALDHASSLEQEMARMLLTADDAAMEISERDASTARRAADRIEALIGQMRVMLAETLTRESADVQRKLRESAIAADEAFVAIWNKQAFPLAEKAAQILVAKRDADEAIAICGQLGVQQARHSAFAQSGQSTTDLLKLILAIAEISPSEIARRQAENDAANVRFHEKRQADAVRQSVLEREGREKMRLEREIDEKKRLDRMLPSGPGRSSVTINGLASSNSIAGRW